MGNAVLADPVLPQTAARPAYIVRTVRECDIRIMILHDFIGCLVKIGCALSVFAVFLVGFFYLVLITRTEEVGTWQGQQVVMQKYSFRDATYSYYRYNGPFLLGESLGWSEIPWDIPEYR